MSASDDGKFYVVFEGRRPSIYSRWVDADVQVCRFKGNRHQTYNTYEEAEYKWIRYCKEHGQWNEYAHSQIHRNKDVASDSGNMSTEMRAANVAEETSSIVFVLQHSMQKQLLQICHCLHIPEPVYTLHEVKMIHSHEYRRYYASLYTGAIGMPAMSISRFAKDDYDGKEDVVALLIRHLLAATGRRIRDFNHYNVHLLEEKLQKVIDEKLELEMEITMLNEKIRQMECIGSFEHTETSSFAD